MTPEFRLVLDTHLIEGETSFIILLEMIQLGPETTYIAVGNSKRLRKNCLGTRIWSSTGRKSDMRLFFPFKNLVNTSWLGGWPKQRTKELLRQLLPHKIKTYHKTSCPASEGMVLTPIGAGVSTWWYLLKHTTLKTACRGRFPNLDIPSYSEVVLLERILPR